MQRQQVHIIATVESDPDLTRVSALRAALKGLQEMAAMIDDDSNVKVHITGIQELTTAEAHAVIDE